MRIITEVRLTRDSVKALCIKNEWYTRGCNEQYEDMLEMVDALKNKDVSNEDLYRIADNIHRYSDFDRYDRIDTISNGALSLDSVR